ncbi:unnamed protein product [Heterobilharzia americana]|nr:unnamed protein product [Heterobilharzia americana]
MMISKNELNLQIRDASVLASRLSSNELLPAFQISFHLMAKISDVMLNVCTSSRNESYGIISPQIPWKYPTYSHSIVNDDSPMGVCSMKTQSTNENDDCETDHQEQQMKLAVEDENLCDSGISSNKDENATICFQRPSPRNENHSPNTFLHKSVSSPNTNESNVIDVDESYPTTDKCEVTETHEMNENSSKTYLKKQNITLRKNWNDKQFEDGQGSSDVSDQNNFELNDSQMTAKFQVDTKRWRLTSADKLNTLIDECERQINGRKLYVCKFCGKIYEIKSSMRYHMKIIHLQMHLRTTEMQCRICGKQFTCVSAVNRHQSKCILSSLAESRMQNNAVSNPFTTTTPPAEEINSQIPLSSFDPWTPDNSKINPSPNHSTPLSDSNVILGSMNSSKLNNVNFQSAFHVPEVCAALLNQTAYTSQLGLGVKNLVPQSHFVSFLNKSENIDPKSLSFQPLCDMQPFLSSVNNPTECFDSQLHSSIWSSMSSLGYNFSELTPAQIDICMKAAVQGIRSTTEKYTNANDTMNQESDHFGQTSGDPSQTDEMQWNPAKRSDLPETKRPLTSQTNEIAMDLSSRPRSATLMIQSF